MKAFEIAGRLRYGEVVEPTELVAALDEIRGQDFVIRVRPALELALFASATREGMYRALSERTRGTIHAVLLDEGDPLSETFPENPWGIARDASLVDAIDHVWDLFDAPRLTNALLERVVALVLLEIEGAPHLGYVHMEGRAFVEKPYVGRPRPPHDRRHAQAWLPFGDLAMFTGPAPSEAMKGKYCDVPAPLHRLYRRHAGLCDRTWYLHGPDEIQRWGSDHLISLFSDDEGLTDVLDIRDPDAPLVRPVFRRELDDESEVRPFVDWLDGLAPYILGIVEDELP